MKVNTMDSIITGVNIMMHIMDNIIMMDSTMENIIMKENIMAPILIIMENLNIYISTVKLESEPGQKL